MRSRNRSCPRDWLAREDKSFAAGWHLQTQKLSVQQGQNYEASPVPLEVHS